MLEIEHVIVLFLYFVVELIEVLMMNKDILNKFLEFVQRCNTEAIAMITILYNVFFNILVKKHFHQAIS